MVYEIKKETAIVTALVSTTNTYTLHDSGTVLSTEATYYAIVVHGESMEVTIVEFTRVTIGVTVGFQPNKGVTDIKSVELITTTQIKSETVSAQIKKVDVLIRADTVTYSFETLDECLIMDAAGKFANYIDATNIIIKIETTSGGEHLPGCADNNMVTAKVVALYHDGTVVSHPPTSEAIRAVLALSSVDTDVFNKYTVTACIGDATAHDLSTTYVGYTQISQKAT